MQPWGEGEEAVGGDVELGQLVAVEGEREEGGDHLGTNHCVGEP